MIRAALNRCAAVFAGIAPRARVRRPGRRDPLGPAGERAAAKMLRRLGYKTLGKNLRCRLGEADLLCMAPDRRTIVIVEVKTRRLGRGAVHPPPEASVHARKRRKLLGITRHLVRANGWTDRPVRIDIVAVDWPATGKPVVRHYVGAVAEQPRR